jgi:hypothetical protein
MAKLKKEYIGKKVGWESSGTKKIGIVRMMIQSGSRLCYASLQKKGVTRSQIKFQPTASVDRVLIEVLRTHKINGEELESHWYAPRLSQDFDFLD